MPTLHPHRYPSKFAKFIGSVLTVIVMGGFFGFLSYIAISGVK